MIETLFWMIAPATITFLWGKDYGAKKALQRELDRHALLEKARKLEEKLEVLEEVEEEQYNKSYGQPDVINYFDQEYAKKGVKQ